MEKTVNHNLNVLGFKYKLKEITHPYHLITIKSPSWQSHNLTNCFPFAGHQLDIHKTDLSSTAVLPIQWLYIMPSNKTDDQVAMSGTDMSQRQDTSLNRHSMFSPITKPLLYYTANFTDDLCISETGQIHKHSGGHKIALICPNTAGNYIP